MKNSVIFPFALAGVLAASSAVLADQGKPMRHLVYKVGVTVTSQTEELTSGQSGDTMSAASNVATYSAGMLSKGTMTADVIGITQDGALAIQISEDTDNRKAPPVRVDVTSDGQLRIPPDQLVNVREEEQALLRMLGRNFISADDVSAGKWSYQLSQDKANVHEDYQITGTQPNGDLLIAVNQQVKMGGAQPSDTTAHGTITYSSKYKVPRLVAIDGRTHNEGVQQTQTQDTKVNLELLSDSFQSGS